MTEREGKVVWFLHGMMAIRSDYWSPTGEPGRNFSVRFERRQGRAPESALTMDEDALVVAEIAEFVRRDFVLFGFGAIDVPFADGA